MSTKKISICRPHKKYNINSSEMTDIDRPFQSDIENKTADELIELYSNLIRRAIGSNDKTYIPALNGNIKDATLRLLELGIEINEVYNQFVEENKEKKTREVIDLVEKEHREQLDGCERIKNLLSSTKKAKKRKSNSSILSRVQRTLFAHGNNSTTPPRHRRSTSDPVQSDRSINRRPKRNNSHGDYEEVESEEEEEEDEEDEANSHNVATIKLENNSSSKQKRRRGRPRKT